MATITHAKAKKKAWDAFSVYIRLRDALRDQMTLDGDRAYCVTCSKAYPVFGVGCLQAGHFIGGRNMKVLFDERQVYAQCFNCNIRLKGNWVPYLKFMNNKYGQEVVQEMMDTHMQTVKLSVPELLELKDKYEALSNDLRQELSY